MSSDIDTEKMGVKEEKCTSLEVLCQVRALALACERFIAVYYCSDTIMPRENYDECNDDDCILFTL